MAAPKRTGGGFAILKNASKTELRPKTVSTAMLVLGGALFLAWALLLWSSVVTHSIETMAQFGDAFAPVTVFFAWIAAIAAVNSYETEREQLSDERRRSHVQRFDDLFFRLLDYYEAEASRSEEIPYAIRTPQAIAITMKQAMQELYSKFERGDFFLFTPKLWREEIGLVTHGRSLRRLADQVCAIVCWLRDSRVPNVRPYGDLLKARLSLEEVWFWQCAIACSRDETLIHFASSMGLIGLNAGMSMREALAIARAAAGAPK